MAARSGHLKTSTHELVAPDANHHGATRRSDDLSALDVELGRLIRRTGRQQQQMHQTQGGAEVWDRWSASIDEGFALIARIERAPARDVAGLVVKFRAILWRIQTDDGVIMDEGLQHSLRRFGRQLTRMARE